MDDGTAGASDRLHKRLLFPHDLAVSLPERRSLVPQVQDRDLSTLRIGSAPLRSESHSQGPPYPCKPRDNRS